VLEVLETIEWWKINRGMHSGIVWGRCRCNKN